MRRYTEAARGHRALIVAICAIVWTAGAIGATVEYRTTFEATATVWVLRASPELAQTSPDDPNVTLLQTAASQQVDLLGQLLETDSFVRDVAERAGLAITGDGDESAYLESIRKRFRVKALGSNLLSISYAARDAATAPRLVDAALAERADRIAQARVASASALTTLYQKDYELAQRQVREAQDKLQAFDVSHPAPLSDVDQHLQAQLRLTLDLAQVRATDLRGRIDRSALAPALIELSGMEFQIVDPPRAPNGPKGGTRAALTIAGIALAAGLGLVALLVLLAAHLPLARRNVREAERRTRVVEGGEALRSPTT